MKNKKKKNSYIYFMFRTLLRALVSMIIVIGVVCFILFLHSKFFAWDIMLLLDKYGLYKPLIENKIAVICIMVCAFALLAFTIIIVRFSKYLSSIEHAVEQIFEDSHASIRLPDELQELEYQLNEIQTKMEKRELAAKESETRKNELIVYLAHDLKTPLASVIGYLNLLAESPELPPETRAKYVGITLDRALHLEDLITELFDITKFNLNNISLSKETINISMMLRQILEEFYPLFSEHNLELEENIATGLIIEGDGAKLARVFDNLLKNAINYSYPNSTLSIQATKEDKELHIAIQNTGDTIPPEKLNLIFEKFYRVDPSRSSQTGGSGLGLAIAREITRLHDGTLTAESRDNRTTFHIRLPFHESK